MKSNEQFVGRNFISINKNAQICMGKFLKNNLQSSEKCFYLSQQQLDRTLATKPIARVPLFVTLQLFCFCMRPSLSRITLLLLLLLATRPLFRNHLDLYIRFTFLGLPLLLGEKLS